MPWSSARELPADVRSAQQLLTAEHAEFAEKKSGNLQRGPAVFAVVVIVATLVPARRATSVDPVVALRAE